MSMFNQLSLTFSCILFLGASLMTPAHAQKAKTPSSALESMNKLKGQDMMEVTYCDVILPRLQSNLQGEANKNCQTKEVTVLCRERKTNQQIYATMFVQPEYAVCPSAYIGATRAKLSGGKLSNNAPPTEVPFQAEIRQSSCVNGKTTLEVVVMGNVLECESNRATYSFLWTIDGQKSGHDHMVTCVCGNEATVQIIQPGTGHTITRTIKLQPCNSNE